MVEGVVDKIDSCIWDSVRTADYWGTGECVKRGNFNNPGLSDFYENTYPHPSVDDMVKRIESGNVSQGGFNVGDPESCVKAVKGCFNQ